MANYNNPNIIIVKAEKSAKKSDAPKSDKVLLTSKNIGDFIADAKTFLTKVGTMSQSDLLAALRHAGKAAGKSYKALSVQTARKWAIPSAMIADGTIMESLADSGVTVTVKQASDGSLYSANYSMPKSAKSEPKKTAK